MNEQNENKGFKTRLKNFAYSVSENTVGSFETNPLEAMQKEIYLLQFLWNLIITLALFAFSSISLIFKVQKAGGFTMSNYVLLIANGVYLLLIFIYFIIYKAKCHHSDSQLKMETTLAYTKFAMKTIKVVIPVILLFNLVENPALKLTTIIVSSFSIFTGFISFFIAIIKLASFNINKDKRIAKAQKSKARNERFDNFYQNARNKRLTKQNDNVIIESDYKDVSK